MTGPSVKRRRPRGSIDANPSDASVLVLDDDSLLTDSIVTRLELNGLSTIGFAEPRDFVRAARAGQLRDIKLMFFDMRLGSDADDNLISAIDMIPVARTYAPHARILIFTQEDISLDDCVRCVALGALGLIPKSDNPDELLLAANVYTRAIDPQESIEEVIRELWFRCQNAKPERKGEFWEMLVANLLSTIVGFSILSTNKSLSDGEIDLIVENANADGFWREVGSLTIVVECKNRIDPPEKKDFHVLLAKINGKAHCRVGIMASWEPVTSGFRDLQRTSQAGGFVYAIDQTHVEAMMGRGVAERSRYLKDTFSAQF